MNEILYQVVAVDSDLIKGYPDKVTCISENENMANGVIYNDYDFKNHRYIKAYVSDNFNIYDKYKEQEDKINNLQSKIDKVIELGDKIIEEHENLVGLTGNLVLNFKQVLNILKEDNK